MAARNRQRPQASNPPGKVTTYNSSGGVITTAGGYTRTWIPEVCTDHLTPGYPNVIRDNPLFIKKVTTKAARLSGNFKLMAGTSVVTRHVYEDYAMSYNWVPLEHGGPDLGYYYTEALAKVNPNVPIVDAQAELMDALTDIPSFTRSLAESLSALRSRYAARKYQDTVYGPTLPFSRMIESSGISGTSLVGGAYVAWSFAIAPLLDMIEDLMRLDQLIAERDARNRKYASEGIKMQLESSSYTVRGKVNLVANGRSFPHTTETTYATKVWMEASFSYDGDPIPSGLTVAQRRSLKRAIATGRRGIGLDSVWEAIPLSWLVDYFANVGSYLKALRGLATYKVTSATIMRTTTVKSVASYVGPSPYSPTSWVPVGAKYEDGSHTVTIKERAIGGLPNWYMRKQWLTPHQTGILTSIGIALAFARR